GRAGPPMRPRDRADRRDLGPTTISRMQPRAAVIGTGFVGVVHVEALRRLGVEVVGVLGSTPERAAAKAAAAGLPAPYASLDDLLADDRVGVVHVATPNHLHV